MKLDYISILRSLSIIMVVIFHVYGYMFADHFPNTKEVYTEIYFWITTCVLINIAMPLFTFISGFLFEYLYVDKGKYRDFLPFAKNKFSRLLVPYFVFGIIMMATTSNFHPLKLFDGSFWHLWYLPRLFWCFMLAWLINWSIKNQYIRLLLLPCLLFYPLLGWNIPTFIGIQGMSSWFGYFYLGMIFSDYKENIQKYISNFHLLFPLLFFYGIITYFFPVEYGHRTWYFIVAVVCVLTSLWYIFSNLRRRTFRCFYPLVCLSKYSFGIYIFHNWVGLYLVGHFSQMIFHLPELAANHTYIFPLVLTVVDLFISTVLSWCLLQFKIGRKLIG